MDKWHLLETLKNHCGDYISGEYISQKFGVTRTAIWKNINELREYGYNIVSKTNNGYKLFPAFNILNQYEIESKFKEKNLAYEVIYKDTTDSTNNDAKKLQNTKNTVVVAEQQTSGRGRYNRNFQSTPNIGIYFTIRINSAVLTITTEDIIFYPLIAAVSVCRAAKKLCDIDLKIKWPNDLLHEDKKICGILTEASIEAETRNVAYVIIGIGINVNNSADDFPDEIKSVASSLRIISTQANKGDVKYDRVDILCEVVDNFTKMLSVPRSSLLSEYRQYLITERRIAFTQNNILYEGITHGINDDGNLVVALDNGDMTAIQSGEINFIVREVIS